LKQGQLKLNRHDKILLPTLGVPAGRCKVLLILSLTTTLRQDAIYTMAIQPSITRVAISGAAGNIGYALLPLLASGYVFGDDRSVELRLLEIPHAVKALAGVRMELIDCAFPCLTDVIITTEPEEAFEGADVIVLVGGFPRKQGMERKDLIHANTKIFTTMGRAIEEVASPNVKVLVVANPANTNCLVALNEASRIPSKNFCALTYLDHQRAKAQVAIRLGVRPNQVKNVSIWGNHSNTQYPDVLTDGYISFDSGEDIPISTLMANDLEWTNDDFVQIVQNRGKHVIEVRGNSSALSAAQATADCLATWLVTGTKRGETISMAVYNDKGYYGVKKGLVFSFPCECRDGDWFVKTGLELSDLAMEKLQVTENELKEEREDAEELIKQTRFRSMSTVSTASLASSTSEMELSVPPRVLTSRI
jgi:malate dehydrogenase